MSGATSLILAGGGLMFGCFVLGYVLGHLETRNLVKNARETARNDRQWYAERGRIAPDLHNREGL